MAERFRDPEIPPAERIAYRGSIGGEPAGTGDQLVEHEERDGATYYRQRLEIEVREEAHYTVEALFRRSRGTISCESYRAETRHGDERVAVEEGRFRGVKGLAWGGELAPFPGDMTPLLGCAVALRGLDLEPGAQRAFSLWLANTLHWEVEARVERMEAVTVPAGRFEAAKVRARPSVERVAGRLHRLIEPLLPPFHVHLAADPPHPMLRFSFPTGPFPWNPRGVIEAVEISVDGRRG